MTGKGICRQISVIGKGGPASEDVMRQAHEVGAHIARAGHILVCGGEGGVMEAAARGAQENGGLTLGILPSYDLTGGNPFLNVRIPTGMAHGRNVIVAASGDGIIAIDGELGTLAEIALALKLGRPVVGLGSWRASSPGFGELDVIVADSAAAAVRTLLDILTRTDRR